MPVACAASSGRRWLFRGASIALTDLQLPQGIWDRLLSHIADKLSLSNVAATCAGTCVHHRGCHVGKPGDDDRAGYGMSGWTLHPDQGQSQYNLRSRPFPTATRSWLLAAVGGVICRRRWLRDLCASPLRPTRAPTGQPEAACMALLLWLRERSQPEEPTQAAVPPPAGEGALVGGRRSSWLSRLRVNPQAGDSGGQRSSCQG